MIAFVTGATGFIGQRLVRKLVEEKYEVLALARSPEKARRLLDPKVRVIPGDILDTSSLSAMQNCDVVYHLAGWYKLGSRDQSHVHKTNVQGTRNVLEMAWKLNVPRIIYTSSLSVYGDTQGLLHDETYQRPPGQSFLTEYDRTKWQAHFQVSLPLISHGAPITITIPGIVYGPGDKSLIGGLIRAYVKGRMVCVPGPETLQTFTYVDDIAEGHLLAFTKGKAGQSYILAGPALPLWQVVRLWATLLRKPAPKFSISAEKLKLLEPLARFLSNHIRMPELLSVDAIRMTGVSYIGSSEKAKSELGWQPCPIEYGFRETLDWFTNSQTELEEA